MKAQYFLALFLLAGCQGIIKNKTAPETDTTTGTSHAAKTIHPPAPAATSSLAVKSKEDLVGYWVGMFEPVNYTEKIGYGDGDSEVVPKMINGGEAVLWDYANKINICIDSVNDNNVVGHSIVAGNDRPFKGTMTFKNNSYHFELTEPGDDKYDGKFSFDIAQNDTLINGTWKANKKIEISERQYSLQKKFFKYNPSVALEGWRFGDWSKVKQLHPVKHTSNEEEEYYDYDKSYFATTEDLHKYNASTQALTAEQVANLKKGDIFILRNAIYAKHGYAFKNRQLRAYFDRESWYIPMYKDVKDDLTELEKKNITLLLRYEKNAKEYYDVFGRG